MNAFPIDVGKLLQISKPLLWMGGHIDKVREDFIDFGGIWKSIPSFLGLLIHTHTHTHTLMSYIFYISHVGVSVLRLVFVLESMIHSLSKAAINMVVKMEGHRN